MTGVQLKQIIAGTGYTQKELSLMMPTIKYDTDWTRILKSDDVKSSVIEQLAQATGRTVGQLYGEQPAPRRLDYEHPDGEAGTYTCDPRLLDIIQARDRQIDCLQQQLDKAQQQIVSLLEKIVGNQR